MLAYIVIKLCPCICTQTCKPTINCGVVVSACVGNAISFIIMWHMRADLAIKSKLQHSHSRETSSFTQIDNAVIDDAQILCNNIRLWKFMSYNGKKFSSNAFAPFSFYGIFCTILHSPISVKRPKMVNSQFVIKFEHSFNSVTKPPKIVLSHFVIVIKWISPQLPLCTKIVRRNTSDFFRLIVFIQIEILWICPNIHAVIWNINRHISNDTNVHLINLLFSHLPLLLEKILFANIISQFARIFIHKFANSTMVMILKLILPLKPRLATMQIFQCHKNCIVN